MLIFIEMFAKNEKERESEKEKKNESESESESEMQKNIQTYKKNYNRYIERIPDRNFIFEIKKCCGYTEVCCINKNETLENLHRNVFFQFKAKPDLYIIDCNTNEKVYIPHSTDVTIRELILKNPQFFQPIYPLPEPVVYRLHYYEKYHDSLCKSCTKFENDDKVIDFSHKNMYFM